MSFFLWIILSSLAAVACAPAIVSLSPLGIRRMRRNAHAIPALLETRPIESAAKRTRIAVRETRPSQGRLLEVADLIKESEDVISVYLKNVDGSELPDFRPGQHLILERPSASGAKGAARCYTLSNGPRQKPWRISVRRIETADESNSVSCWIHRELRVGDRIRVRGPRGSFTLDKADSGKPVVFIAAGVGITPMASMLQEELSYPRSRAKWLFYQVRHWEAAPLLPELAHCIEKSCHCNAWVAASRSESTPKCQSKRFKLLLGKLDASSMIDAIGATDVSVFLCGPSAWMQHLRNDLIACGVPSEQIFDEAFGSPEMAAGDVSPPALSTSSQATCQVTFEASGKTAVWTNQSNLLELAKSSRVEIPASCRTGKCGTCAVKLLRGTVHYSCQPEAEITDQEILPCVCTPTSDVAIQA